MHVLVILNFWLLLFILAFYGPSYPVKMKIDLGRACLDLAALSETSGVERGLWVTWPIERFFSTIQGEVEIPAQCGDRGV